MKKPVIIQFVGSGETRQGEEKEEKMVIFHAGSLAVPFSKISALFEERRPRVKVQAESAGSRESARKISELSRECDVFGSADYQVVRGLLQPKYADFNLLFATNEMVIAFTERSREAHRLNRDNWPEILLSRGVNFGRSDPNHDPCGYRTLMVLQLAERYFKMPGLAAQLEQKHGRKFVRPKETDLLSLLETGELDYVFIYKSVTVQHGLRFVDLPDEINLGRFDLADRYRGARVRVTGGQPGRFVELQGEPIAYSVTIPTNARHPDVAAEWIALLFSSAGRAIFEECGQQVIQPPVADGYDRLPAVLAPLCRRLAGPDELYQSDPMKPAGRERGEIE